MPQKKANVINNCLYFNPGLGYCIKAKVVCMFIADTHSCPMYVEVGMRPYITPTAEDTISEMHDKGINYPTETFINKVQSQLAGMGIATKIVSEKPLFKCTACGSDDCWERPDGGRVCGVCHPNPNREQVPEVPDWF